MPKQSLAFILGIVLTASILLPYTKPQVVEQVVQPKECYVFAPQHYKF